MKLAIQAILMMLFAVSVTAQQNNNLELIANMPLPTDGNDIWGYVDGDGTEYAIIGAFTDTRIFSLEDPANPIERAVIPGASSIWRDIKSYNDHVYITTDDYNEDAGETPDGLTIVDMSMAPETITFTKWQPDIDFNGVTGRLGECHNIYVDPTTGYGYLAGCQGVGEEGVIILDLFTDPKEPQIVSIIDDFYAHDVYVKDDLLYASNILEGILSMHDISDKANPQLLGTAVTTSFFTHNAWGSDDNQFAFTTDERARGRVDSYDISDPENIVRLDDFRPADRFADNAIPHNTHYKDGFLVTSWYTEGLVVIDANKPDNLIKVASYDTFTEEASIPNNQANRWFYGLWGAYPYLPSGLMLGSDINSGLYIWRPVKENGGAGEQGFVRACYLEGTITDKLTGTPVSNVDIEILAGDGNESTSIAMGSYKTGQLTPGTFDVRFTHPNYEDLVLSAELINGEVTILDAELVGNEIMVTVVGKEDGLPVADASVVLENVASGFTTQVQTDVDGKIIASLKPGETYNVYAGKWGHTGAGSDPILSDGVTEITLEIGIGYEDDFFADLGWEVETTAESGEWTQGVPNNITSNGQTTQTSLDIPTDIGIGCYATGLTGTTAGANDIDDGFTLLISPPLDFEGMDTAFISYYLFFANVGGNTPADDEVTVMLSNGNEEVALTGFNEPTFAWSDLLEHTILASEIEFTSAMRFMVRAVDQGPGHVAEAQLDVFRAEATKAGGVATEDEITRNIAIYPNPTMDEIIINIEDGVKSNSTYKLYNIDGELMRANTLTSATTTINTAGWLAPGMYFIHVIEGNKSHVSKIVKL